MAQASPKSAVNIDSGASQYQKYCQNGAFSSFLRTDFQQVAQVSEFGATCYNR
jgi:hypothetical protein